MNATNENLEIIQNLNKSPIDDFEYLNFLGKGTYGKVFQVRKIRGKDENKMYAIKTMSKSFIVNNNRKSFGHVVSEFNILKSIKHSFLNELMYVFQEKTEIHFVLEYLSGGTLDALLEKQNLFSEPDASFYMKEIILAIEHLHSKNIIHRDLKPQNVLLDSSGHVKLADFGLSKKIRDGNRTRTICGSPAYMAPEIRTRRGYGKAVDWWALGVLIYKLLVGQKPFISGNLKDLKLKISKGNFIIPGSISLDAKDLLTQLIQVDLNERLGSCGAHKIKNHKFFANTSWDKVSHRLETPPFIPNVNITSNEILPGTATKNDEEKKFNNNLFKDFYFVSPELEEKPEKLDILDSAITSLTTSFGNFKISKSDNQ